MAQRSCIPWPLLVHRAEGWAVNNRGVVWLWRQPFLDDLQHGLDRSRRPVVFSVADALRLLWEPRGCAQQLHWHLHQMLVVWVLQWAYHGSDLLGDTPNICASYFYWGSWTLEVGHNIWYRVGCYEHPSCQWFRIPKCLTETGCKKDSVEMQALFLSMEPLLDKAETNWKL